MMMNVPVVTSVAPVFPPSPKTAHMFHLSVPTSSSLQESVSEAINAWAGLLLWGAAVGLDDIADLGAYLYASETAAAREYWCNDDGDRWAQQSSTSDGSQPQYGHNYASIIWGGKAVYGTWFSSDVEAIRGINLLPVSPALFPLAANRGYAAAFIGQLMSELQSGGIPWPRYLADVFWCYQALFDPAAALAGYSGAVNAGGYAVEPGESQAHTYSWVMDLSATGPPNSDVTTADTLTYAVFTNSAGRNTYAALNPKDSAVYVRFTDGGLLSVPPRSLAWSGALSGSVRVSITSSPQTVAAAGAPASPSAADGTPTVSSSKQAAVGGHLRRGRRRRRRCCGDTHCGSLVAAAHIRYLSRAAAASAKPQLKQLNVVALNDQPFQWQIAQIEKDRLIKLKRTCTCSTHAVSFRTAHVPGSQCQMIWF